MLHVTGSKIAVYRTLALEATSDIHVVLFHSVLRSTRQSSCPQNTGPSRILMLTVPGVLVKNTLLR